MYYFVAESPVILEASDLAWCVVSIWFTHEVATKLKLTWSRITRHELKNADSIQKPSNGRLPSIERLLYLHQNQGFLHIS